MVLKVLQKFPPYTGIGPWMALPSLENALTYLDLCPERTLLTFSLQIREGFWVLSHRNASLRQMC